MKSIAAYKVKIIKKRGCLTKVKWGSPKIMLKMEVMHIVSFEI